MDLDWSKAVKKAAKKYITHQQSKINYANQRRLVNNNFTLICSNCAGGILYHSLGLEFRSPFINLFLTNHDFLYVIENLEAFLKTDIVEDRQSMESYPVGIGLGDVRIHFMNYQNFQEGGLL